MLAYDFVITSCGAVHDTLGLYVQEKPTYRLVSFELDKKWLGNEKITIGRDQSLRAWTVMIDHAHSRYLSNKKIKDSVSKHLQQTSSNGSQDCATSVDS